MASTQSTILTAVKTALATALTGRGYTSDNTRIRRRSTVEGMGDGKKAVLSPMPETLAGDVTNEQDDIGFGVLITLAHAGNANPEYNDTFDDLLEDREAVWGYFHNDTTKLSLSLAAGLFYIGLKIEPGPILIAEHFYNNVDATALVLRVLVRKTHG